MRYAFGKNWQAYLAHAFDSRALEQSRKNLLTMLGRDDLCGRSFLDIGSGSGVHSLAAWDAGARPVVSIDVDPDSVAATASLHALRGAPPDWRVLRGDVLDPAFMATLPSADIVYSWGVLHHTGDVWRALDAACSKLAPDGTLFIALYASEVFDLPSHDYWLNLKRAYNTASGPGRLAMELDHVWSQFLGRRLANLPAFLRRAARYRRNRGMSLWYDVRDWLGGWPMQFCSMTEVDGRLSDRGFSLRRFVFGGGCTEYVYAPAAAPGVGVTLLGDQGQIADRPLVVAGGDPLVTLAFRESGAAVIARLYCDGAGRLTNLAGGEAVTAATLAVLPETAAIVLVGGRWEGAAAALAGLTRRPLAVCHPEDRAAFPRLTRLADLPEGPLAIVGTRPPAEALARHLRHSGRLAGFACVERSGRFLGRPCLPLAEAVAAFPADTAFLNSNIHYASNAAVLAGAGARRIYDARRLAEALFFGVGS